MICTGQTRGEPENDEESGDQAVHGGDSTVEEGLEGVPGEERSVFGSGDLQPDADQVGCLVSH